MVTETRDLRRTGQTLIHPGAPEGTPVQGFHSLPL